MPSLLPGIGTHTRLSDRKSKAFSSHSGWAVLPLKPKFCISAALMAPAERCWFDLLPWNAHIHCSKTVSAGQRQTSGLLVLALHRTNFMKVYRGDWAQADMQFLDATCSDWDPLVKRRPLHTHLCFPSPPARPECSHTACSQAPFCTSEECKTATVLMAQGLWWIPLVVSKTQ